MFETLKVCIDDNMMVLLIVCLYLLQTIFTFAIKTALNVLENMIYVFLNYSNIISTN